MQKRSQQRGPREPGTGGPHETIVLVECPPCKVRPALFQGGPWVRPSAWANLVFARFCSAKGRWFAGFAEGVRARAASGPGFEFLCGQQSNLDSIVPETEAQASCGLATEGKELEWQYRVRKRMQD